VNRAEIPLTKKVVYSIRITNIKNKWLMIGFCTSQGLSNEDNYKNAESAYYSCSGALFEGGIYRPMIHANTGDVIDCYADLQNSKIEWWRMGNNVATCSIPNQMRNKVIYFSIILCCKGDEVDLSI
jgi:hypothetical protein